MVLGSGVYNTKWNYDYNNKEGIRDKLREVGHSQTPLKPRIEEAQKKLQIQIAKLDEMSSKLRQKDNAIFSRIVKAMQSHDSHYGRLLSGELSQIRKTIKTIDSARNAFEQIQLRLNTMTELGDVVVTLNPAMNAIKGIQGGLSSMMPQADQSLGQISDLLSNIMADSSQTSSTTAALDSSSIKLDEEAMDILQEATSVVEEDTREKLPDLPLSKHRVGSNTEAPSSLDV
jgi:division protein CdvB (Snf7/Vps24/ESCRT-III family)